jgi:hypothetical protein
MADLSASYPSVVFPNELRELVSRFGRNRDDLVAAGYTETALRREFIDPFFVGLGWDVDNRAGIAEAYKDVVHEDRIEGEAPDYAFRVGGTRRFFVEAKRPAVNIRRDPGPSFQLRRYSWSAKLSLGIVTNFAELAVYDTRVQPSAADLSSVARILSVRFDEYEARWNEVASIFSRDAVWRGWFDRFAEASRGKRGTAEVDAAFLREIEQWRNDLAKNLALRNSRLSQVELNFLVQATLDRIIFLRICEDRGLEPLGRLEEAVRGKGAYQALLSLFRDADARYNSGLFHFAHEAGRAEAPDRLSDQVVVADHILKSIVDRLYYPASPYAFSVLPADILGQVYERFLGKHILLVGEHSVRIEDKPDVRRAGGVYYTPAYVVAYIIKHTLLPVANSRAAATPSAEPLPSFAVVDPACGSGSFLIQAYDALLDWYLTRYKEDPERWSRTKTPRVFRGATNDWQLTTPERKRILLAHIFGVDIDAQAVEVTKLSLLLKVLEAESSESIQQDLRLLKERALPDLGRNIKCGNSLVGSDVYGDAAFAGVSTDVVARLNPFDWATEFPGAVGGFDVVIGNPPYLYRKADDADLTGYYRATYRSAEGNFELYKFFLEQGLKLLRPEGRLGMIVSASFLVQNSFEKLRTILATESTIQRLAPLGPGVFNGVAVDTAVIVAAHSGPATSHHVTIQAPTEPTALESTAEYLIPQARFRANPRVTFDYRLNDAGARLVQRLRRTFPSIESGFEFGVGINTGFIRGEMVTPSQIDARYHPMVPGDGIERYGPVTTRGWIMYDADFVKSRGTRGRSLPPTRFFDNPKLLVVRTRNLSLRRRLIATIDESKAYNLNRLTNIVARDGYSLHGLLGILNSALFNWLFAGAYYDYEIKPTYLRGAPMADVNDGTLVKGVKALLSARERVNAARTAQDREREDRRARALERLIDNRVAELYGLTQDETESVARYRSLVEQAEAVRVRRRRPDGNVEPAVP